MPLKRDYEPLFGTVESAIRDRAGERWSRSEAMNLACDLLWEAFGPPNTAAGPGPEPGLISWVGFYAIAKGHGEMTLVARRDKPACSPIGLHGACGRSWSRQVPLVVTDVKSLGSAYIACDPHDQSEVVIPLFEGGGGCWGVLDADSYDTDAFGEKDVEGMSALLERLGLTTGVRPRVESL